jgi:hypothetical protein
MHEVVFHALHAYSRTAGGAFSPAGTDDDGLRTYLSLYQSSKRLSRPLELVRSDGDIIGVGSDVQRFEEDLER